MPIPTFTGAFLKYYVDSTTANRISSFFSHVYSSFSFSSLCAFIFPKSFTTSSISPTNNLVHVPLLYRVGQNKDIVKRMNAFFAVRVVEIRSSLLYFSYYRFHSPFMHISPIKHSPAVWAHHRFSLQLIRE